MPRNFFVHIYDVPSDVEVRITAGEEESLSRSQKGMCELASGLPRTQALLLPLYKEKLSFVLVHALSIMTLYTSMDYIKMVRFVSNCLYVLSILGSNWWSKFVLFRIDRRSLEIAQTHL